MKSYLNEKGSTLITTMVTVAIVAIVSFAITKLITDSMMGQKQIEYSQAVTVIQNSIIGHLSNRAVCTVNFQGTNPETNEDIPNRIVQGDGSTSFLENFSIRGSRYENSMVEITNIRFNSYQASTLASAGPPPEPEKGAVNLGIGFRSSVQLGGPRDIARNVKLVVERNASGDISSCVAVGNDDDDIWRLNAAGDIFYVGNNVGIGTDSPTARLTVIGSMNVTGTGNVLSAAEVNSASVQTGIARSTAYLYRSDERYKRNIKISKGLEIVRELVGRSYQWRDSGKPSLGVIAQEVERVIPSAVSSDFRSGVKYVDYAQLLAPMIESVKELDRKNREIEAQVRSLENKLNQGARHK